MTLYELIFIILFLGSVVSLLVSAFLWRRSASRTILVRLASTWFVYLGILAVTNVFRSQRVFMVGEDECFDEMCFAVVDQRALPAQSVDASDGYARKKYVIAVRMTSHSRGRAQAEGGLRGRLYEGGSYVNISEGAQKALDAQHGEKVRLTRKLSPGESAISLLVFEPPQSMTNPALVLDHGFTPGYFVIGESPFFHKPHIHQLPKDR
jgi:hypothetical protein